MIRVLFAAILALVSAAASAVTVGVNVSYTTGAANYAASLGGGVTVGGLVANQIATANAAYAASGIDIVLVVVTEPQPSGPSAPADSATMQTQYNWVRDSPMAQLQRGDQYTGSSISIQISDPGAGASTQGVMFNGTVTGRADAVFSLPVRGLTGGNGMELAISKIIGSDPAYGRRENLYPSEGYGSALCAHTREGANPISTSTPVPNLSPVYSLGLLPTVGPETDSSPTAQITCEYARAAMAKANQCGSPNTCVTAIGINAPTKSCTFYNISGGVTATYALGYATATGSAPITCTESQTTTYSSPSLTFEGRAMGDSTHDSVSKMNARKSVVAGWAANNLNLLRRAQEAVGMVAAFKLRHGL